MQDRGVVPEVRPPRPPAFHTGRRGYGDRPYGCEVTSVGAALRGRPRSTGGDVYDFPGGAMVGQVFLDDAIRQFHGQKKLVERALAQVPDEALFSTLDESSNSIAVILKHMAGNMVSRWTDFLVSDGEKPDRNRDSEFELAEGDTRESLLARWENGWQRLFAAMEPLSTEDLERQVTIRGEPHSVVKAINRQLTHYAYHSGQIVLLAKHHAGARWVSLSIPKGQSELFNRSRTQPK